MPTLFVLFGLRFYFYSDKHLPIHVHVENADGKAKFNVILEIALVYNKGLKQKDLKLAEKIINENKEIIISRWNEYHGE